MSISIIAAIADNNAIGIKNGLPWKLAGDLKYFSKTTTGKTVVMGLNTYKSIVSMIGKPLQNRKNIVLTLKKEDGISDQQITSFDELKKLGEQEDIFVIGGASVFNQTLPFAQKLFLTRVHAEPEGDAFFPKVDFSQYQKIFSEPHKKDDKNDHDYTFEVYEKLTN